MSLYTAVTSLAPPLPAPLLKSYYTQFCGKRHRQCGSGYLERLERRNRVDGRLPGLLSLINLQHGPTKVAVTRAKRSCNVGGVTLHSQVLPLVTLVVSLYTARSCCL